MIALDTNVLVRFLADDDPTQSPVAARIVQRAIDAGEHLFVPTVVLVETVWVLARAYKVPREELATVVDAVLRARHFAFDEDGVLARAARAYRDGTGDFADYVILEETRAGGAEALVTFDRALWKEPGARRAS